MSPIPILIPPSIIKGAPFGPPPPAGEGRVGALFGRNWEANEPQNHRIGDRLRNTGSGSSPSPPGGGSRLLAPRLGEHRRVGGGRRSRITPSASRPLAHQRFCQSSSDFLPPRSGEGQRGA